MYQETHTRSIVKALSWRVTGTLATGAIVYFFTKRWDVALIAGGVEMVGKLGIYYAHERIWDRIQLGRRTITPTVLWFTGFSGAGKTTLSHAVIERLKKRNLRVEHLDGDMIRNIFPKTGFSREEREEHIKRVAYLASRLEKNGVFVVVSLISPYEASREFARGICDNFFEIYLSTPLGECEKRDPKGLYRKARSGEVQNFTGITAPYEPPRKPELTLDTSSMSIDQAADRILDSLKRYL